MWSGWEGDTAAVLYRLLPDGKPSLHVFEGVHVGPDKLLEVLRSRVAAYRQVAVRTEEFLERVRMEMLDGAHGDFADALGAHTYLGAPQSLASAVFGTASALTDYHLSASPFRSLLQRIRDAESAVASLDARVTALGG